MQRTEGTSEMADDSSRATGLEPEETAQLRSDEEESTEGFPTDQAQNGSTQGDSGLLDQTHTSVSFQPDSILATDIESQRRYAPVAPMPPAGTKTQPPRKRRSTTWYWVGCLLVMVLLGTGGFLGYWLTQRDDDDTPTIEPEGTTPAPTASPTVGLTTAFEPIRGDCDFMGLKNPHVIDQCSCVGEIQIIAEDVRDRYASHRETFIPTLYEEFEEVISSCSARNQALVWLSSANDYEFERDERVQRYALASVYAGLSGSKWDEASNLNWLSTADSCTWASVECFTETSIQRLVLEGINAVGTVSGSYHYLRIAASVSFSCVLFCFAASSRSCFVGKFKPAVGWTKRY
jgi:hypothetical protein